MIGPGSRASEDGVLGAVTLRPLIDRSSTGPDGLKHTQPSNEHDREPRVRLEHPATGISVVRLVGEHDLATRDEVAAAIDSALMRDVVVIDLTTTLFIDSSILHVLVKGAQSASARGSRLVLVLGSNDSVIQTLELVGLLPEFERTDSIEAALANFGGSTPTRDDDPTPT
jgi:anti-anti-sigma factor